MYSTHHLQYTHRLPEWSPTVHTHRTDLLQHTHRLTEWSPTVQTQINSDHLQYTQRLTEWSSTVHPQIDRIKEMSFVIMAPKRSCTVHIIYSTHTDCQSDHLQYTQTALITYSTHTDWQSDHLQYTQRLSEWSPTVHTEIDRVIIYSTHTD
jgi:hypothetical protein